MHIGRLGVCLEYYSTKSGYGLLERVGNLGNQIRKLVGGLRKFGSWATGSVVWSCSLEVDCWSKGVPGVRSDLGVLWQGDVELRVILSGMLL
eukprot:5700350-Ditylum_brightwellii.AAC.1